MVRRTAMPAELERTLVGTTIQTGVAAQQILGKLMNKFVALKSDRPA